ncbi:MAG: peptidoglycan-binding protein [Chloroflexaceae bacterium]
MSDNPSYQELLAALAPEAEVRSPRRPPVPGNRRRVPPRPPGRPWPPPPPPPPPAPRRRLSSARIRWIQAALNRLLGTRLAVNGVLDLPTRSAIRAFQRRRGLIPNGYPGPRTVAALQAALRASRTSGGASGQRCVVLSDFAFDRAELTPRHQQQIAALARHFAATGVTAARIIGHTDPAGTDAYNLALGQRRARQVAIALRQSLERLQPGLGRRVRLSVESRGEREPVPGLPARQRRVEICYVSGAPPRVVEDGTCGVPARSLLDEISLEASVEELEPETSQVAVRPRLCLYQNSPVTSHRNHFRCGATRQARRMGALAVPTTGDCPRQVGATPYGTGADIIAAIERAYRCLGRPIESIHIFGHSGSNGVYGVTAGRVGLYRSGETGIDRASGARTVSDIPTAALSPDVVIVLHGCNQAAGSDNFALDLYQHLAARLRNPRVFGHYNGGCASRNDSWREYSRRYPQGRNVSNAAGYTSVGCCG